MDTNSSENPDKTTQGELEKGEASRQTKISPFWKQLYAASPCTIASVSTGMLYGYSAILIPDLTQPDTEIQVTLETASWVASALPLFMIFGCLLGGPIMAKYGRKMSHYIFHVPKLIGWLAIYFAPNFALLLAGRIISGLSVGMLAQLYPAYIGEICEPKYRGMMLAGPATTLTFGIFFSHILGTFLHWRTVALIAAMIPIGTFIMIYFIPESPSWLISNDRFNDALKAFEWLRGINNNSKQEFDEMWNKHKTRNIRDQENFFMEIILTLQRPEFLKPFGIICCFFAVLQFSGPYIVTFYTVTIFDVIFKTGTDEYVIMNVIDFIRFAMVVCAAVLLLFVRRRVLMYVSGIGSAISAMVLALYLFWIKLIFWIENYTWIPVVTLLAYTIFTTVGIVVLPWNLAGEIFPIDCRSVGASLSISFNAFLGFLAVKFAPAVFEMVGMDGSFLLYSVVCIVGTTIIGKTLPETKDRTLLEIEMHFTK